MQQRPRAYVRETENYEEWRTIMLGRSPEMNHIDATKDAALKKRYQRCIYTDLKEALDYLKEFSERLDNLHPEVLYKIRSMM